MNTTARLLIKCNDQPGIVSAVSTFFFDRGANITALDQHSTDPEGGVFFMRLEFQTPRLDVSCNLLETAFAHMVAKRYRMLWDIHYACQPKYMAILVSKYDHVLLELLWQASRHDLETHIKMVISNHEDCRALVERFNIPFYHIPVNGENKPQAELKILKQLQSESIELVVLARYMQILSSKFVAEYRDRIINIHHSFLPSFIGADPYQQAYVRGVKLIGATAHFVTDSLDEGPIIEQDVARVSHRQTVASLKALGNEIERTVMARAVKWYLEDRIIIHNNKTVVFN